MNKNAGERQNPALHAAVIPIEDADALAQACAILAQDGVLAAPTDTVYGLLCRYDRPAAVARLFAIKNRPLQRPIPVLISSPSQLERLVPLPLEPLAQRLVDEFWPGALTLVLPSRPDLPSILTAGLPSVAVRMPDHESLRALLQAAGPLAATSANRSGLPETHSAAQVVEQLGAQLPLVLTDSRRESACGPRQPASTIVDLTHANAYRILRDGTLAPALLKQLGPLQR